MSLLARFRTEVLLEDAAGIPALDSSRRPGALDEAAVVDRLKAFAAPAKAEHLRALALLWHDHLDASHRVSQELGDGDGSYLHGIMHRREGDYGNAKYWFHRAGPHPVHAALAVAAAEPGAAFLAPKGRWDPDAFVDCCAAGGERWRALQARELALLAGYLLGEADAVAKAGR